MLNTPPAWSYTWCYVSFFSAVFTFIGLILTIAIDYKKLSLMSIAIMILSTTAAIATLMTSFWTCRSALRPYARTE
jgi:hypothetical protein